MLSAASNFHRLDFRALLSLTTTATPGDWHSICDASLQLVGMVDPGTSFRPDPGPNLISKSDSSIACTGIRLGLSTNVHSLVEIGAERQSALPVSSLMYAGPWRRRVFPW